jgi:hypothetical protein
LALHEVAVQLALPVELLTPQLSAQPVEDVVVGLVDPGEYRLRLAEYQAEYLDEDPDGPDSPEADHAFWESTAEEHLEG